MSFPGAVRFFKVHPCGTQLPWELFQEKRSWGKAPKDKMKDRKYHSVVTEPDMVHQHQPSHPHTKGNPQVRPQGVCVAPAAGPTNPPGLGVVVPEVDAQLEQDQTVLTGAVRSRDRAGRALVISGHSRALINTRCFSKTHFPAQQPRSPDFGQVDQRHFHYIPPLLKLS